MANVKRNQLSTLKVKNLSVPGTYTDGHGLTLRVHPSGGRNWVLRLTVDGKRRNFGLGGYPDVSLREARLAAEEIRQRVRRGEDPAQQVIDRPRIPTLAEVTDSVIEMRAPTWTSERHATQWRESLRLHALPALGKMRIDAVSVSDVLGVLMPIWASKPETAGRIRQRLSVIFDFAIAAGWRLDNPCSGALKAALPRRPRQKRHHAALPYTEVPQAIDAIRNSTAHRVTKAALEFLIVTASRAGEVRGVLWDEIDLKARTWTVPAERMKMRREHRVPLSDRAMAILDQARERTGGAGLVFESNRKAGHPLTNTSFYLVLRRVGYGHVTTHGFRSSFRDWTLEQTSFPWAVCEAALAHAYGGAEVMAYARSDLFERRRALMQDWAKFVLGSVDTLQNAAVNFR